MGLRTWMFILMYGAVTRLVSIALAYFWMEACTLSVECLIPISTSTLICLINRVLGGLLTNCLGGYAIVYSLYLDKNRLALVPHAPECEKELSQS